MLAANISQEYNIFFFDQIDAKYVNKNIKTQNIHGLIPSANQRAIPNSIGQALFNDISFQKILVV